MGQHDTQAVELPRDAFVLRGACALVGRERPFVKSLRLRYSPGSMSRPCRGPHSSSTYSPKRESSASNCSTKPAGEVAHDAVPPRTALLRRVLPPARLQGVVDHEDPRVVLEVDPVPETMGGGVRVVPPDQRPHVPVEALGRERGSSGPIVVVGANRRSERERNEDRESQVESPHGRPPGAARA